jgi:chromosome segregation ATPase
VSNGFGLMIESLVAVLLVLTIAYSVLLNKRLKRLKSDELALKATISELITATEIAERAIIGLKVTVRDCDQGLGEKLRNAERFTSEITRQIEAGEDICKRLAQIVSAARPVSAEAATAIAPDANATVKAAQAFAARARNRTHGLAA